MPPRAARLAADVLRVLPRKRLSRAVGRLATRPWPDPVTRTAIAVYERAFGVDMTDFEVPDGGFESFDAFFTRRLRPGVRREDPDPQAFVSPADGTIADRGPIESGASLLVKGRRYSVAELAEVDAAEEYVGGWFVMVYLHPRDYHRVHAPIDGIVRGVRHVPGTLFPVNAIGEDHIESLFARNERVVVPIESGDGPPVLLLMVGALGVGRISLAITDLETNTDDLGAGHRTLDPPVEIARGEEVGAFHMGSTAIVVVPPNRATPSGPEAGERVLLGDRIGVGRPHAG